MSESQEPAHPPFDPFRALALVAITLGLVIVVVDALLGFLTGHFNAGIGSMGVMLAAGGGLKQAGERLMDRIPTYYQGPEAGKEPPSPPPPKKKP
jgi:hypothetical protein